MSLRVVVRKWRHPRRSGDSEEMDCIWKANFPAMIDVLSLCIFIFLLSRLPIQSGCTAIGGASDFDDIIRRRTFRCDASAALEYAVERHGSFKAAEGNGC